MQEIPLRRKYLPVGKPKKMKAGTNNSGKSQNKDNRSRVYNYDPSKHVLIIGANGKRRWRHEQ